MKKTTRTIMIATLCAVLVGGVVAPAVNPVSAASKPTKVATTVVKKKSTKKLLSQEQALNILKWITV